MSIRLEPAMAEACAALGADAVNLARECPL
jgi:hypothetical protein